MLSSHLKTLPRLHSNLCISNAMKRRAQPHNAYNIFFILERKRLIHEMEGSCGAAVVDHHPQLPYNLDGYDICLPDRPPRFQHLKLPQGWFVPGKNSNRKHVKSHGCEFSVVWEWFHPSPYFILQRVIWYSSSDVISPSCTDCGRKLEERWQRH